MFRKLLSWIKSRDFYNNALSLKRGSAKSSSVSKGAEETLGRGTGAPSLADNVFYDNRLSRLQLEGTGSETVPALDSLWLIKMQIAFMPADRVYRELTSSLPL